MAKDFKVKSYGCNSVYVTGLLNEYDQILLGNRTKYSSVYFAFSKPTNESMALSVFKYAIEKYIKWSPLQAFHSITIEILHQMHLKPLLEHIIFPPELNFKKDLWYIVQRIYPNSVSLNKRALVTKLFTRILNGETSKFPSDYFFDEEAELRACICLQYVLEHYLVFKNIESIYDFFSDKTLAMRNLKKYHLDTVCKTLYDSPLEYLHSALPEHQKDIFLYQYYSFVRNFKIIYK